MKTKVFKTISEKDILNRIDTIDKDFEFIINQYPKEIGINAIVALQQVDIKARLDELYNLLGRKRPVVKMDNYKMMNY